MGKGKNFSDFTYGVGLDINASSFKQVKNDLKLNLDTLSKMVKSYGKVLKIDPNADLSKLYDEVRKIQSIVNGINGSDNSFAGFVDKGVLTRIASLETGLNAINATSKELETTLSGLKSSIAATVEPLTAAGSVKYPNFFEGLKDQSAEIQKVQDQIKKLEDYSEKASEIANNIDNALRGNGKKTRVGNNGIQEWVKQFHALEEVANSGASAKQLLSMTEQYGEASSKLYTVLRTMSAEQISTSGLDGYRERTSKTLQSIIAQLSNYSEQADVKVESLEKTLEKLNTAQEKYTLSLKSKDTAVKSLGIAKNEDGSNLTLRAKIIPDTTASEWITKINDTIAQIEPSLSPVRLTPTFSKSKNIAKEAEGNLAQINHTVGVDIKVDDNIEQFNEKIKNIDSSIKNAKRQLEQNGNFKIKFEYEEGGKFKDAAYQIINKFKKIDANFYVANGKKFIQDVAGLRTKAQKELKDIPANFIVGNQDPILASVTNLRTEIDKKIGNIGVKLYVENTPEFISQINGASSLIKDDIGRNNAVNAMTDLSDAAKKANEDLIKSKSILKSLMTENFDSQWFTQLGDINVDGKKIKGSTEKLQKLLQERKLLQHKISGSFTEEEWLQRYPAANGNVKALGGLIRADSEKLRQIESELNTYLQKQIAYAQSRQSAAEKVLHTEKEVASTQSSGAKSAVTNKKIEQIKKDLASVNNLIKELKSNGFKSSEFLKLGDIGADGNKVEETTKKLRKLLTEYNKLKQRVSPIKGAGQEQWSVKYPKSKGDMAKVQKYINKDEERIKQIEDELGQYVQKQLAFLSSREDSLKRILSEEQKITSEKTKQSSTDNSAQRAQKANEQLAISAAEASKKVKSLNGTLTQQKNVLKDLDTSKFDSKYFAKLGEWDKEAGGFKKNSQEMQQLINRYKELRDARIKSGGQKAVGEEASIRGKLAAILREQKKHINEIIAKNQAELESAKQVVAAYKQTAANKEQAAKTKIDVDTTVTTKRIDELTIKLKKAKETLDLLKSNKFDSLGSTGLGDVNKRLESLGSKQTFNDFIDLYNKLIAKRNELEQSGKAGSPEYIQLAKVYQGVEEQLKVIYKDQLKYTQTRINQLESEISKEKEVLRVKQQQTKEDAKQTNATPAKKASTTGVASSIVKLDGATLNSLAKDSTLKSIDGKVNSILGKLGSGLVVNGANVTIDAANVSVSGSGNIRSGGSTNGNGAKNPKKDSGNQSVNISTLSSYARQLTVFEEQIKRSGLYTENFKQKLAELQTQLNAVNVKDDFDTYKFDLDRFREDFEQLKTYDQLYKNFVDSQAKQIQLHDKISTSSGPTAELQEQLKIQDEISRDLELQLTQYTTLYNNRAKQLAMEEAIKKANQEIAQSSAAQSDKDINKQNNNLAKIVDNAQKKLKDMQYTMSNFKVPMADSAVAKLKEYEQLLTTLKTKQQEIAVNPDLLKDADYGKGFNDLIQRMQVVHKEFETLRKSSDDFFSKIKSIDDVKPLGSTFDSNNLAQLHNEMREFANQAGLGAAKLIEFNDVERTATFEIQNGKGLVQQLTIAYDEATNSLGRYVTRTKASTSETQKFLNSLKHSFQNVARYIASFGSVYRLFSVIRQGVTYVKEIDSALVELKKVTDETDASYNQFLQDMSKTSSVIGSTVKDLTTMASEWARLGYSMEDAGKLAESTAILLNVSEFDDATKASEALISTMQAFQYTADESQHVVDILNEVGNNYAVSSDGIATALQDSASALMEGGNNLEQATALVAAANRVVQDPNSVGSALRTISLRLRGTSVKILEEMGEETDGVVESTSKLQAKIEALSGVNILTEAGDYKDTYTILKEIGTVWEDMSDIDQAALLELMAGKNRANTLSAILSNMEDLEGAYESAMNAEGSALKENETYLDSIQGRLDLFTNEVQTFWMNLISSDMAKAFVDLGTGIVDFVDKVGLIPTALAGVVLYFTALKKVSPITMFKEMAVSMQNYGQALNQVKSINTMFGSIGTMSMTQFKAGPINAYAAAVQNLTAKQQAAALASAGLTRAQIQETMAKNGVEAANIKQALSETHVATAKTATTSATVAEALALKQEEMGKLSATAVTWLLANSSKQLTFELVQEAIQHGVIAPEIGAEIIAKYNLVNANNAASFSFRTLGESIKYAFMSNPVGVILTLATTILTIVVPAIKKFHKSAEELEAEVTELTKTYETAKKSFSENLTELTTSSDPKLYATLSDEFERLTRGVDEYGNNISLTSDQYERYKEICEKIVGINPEIAAGYDSATKAIGNNASALQQLIELQKIQQRQNVKELLKDEKLETLASSAYAKFDTARNKKSYFEDAGLNYFDESSEFATRLKEALTHTTSSGQDWEIDEFDLFSIFGLSDLYEADPYYDAIDFVDEYYSEILSKLKEAADRNEGLTYKYQGSGATLAIGADDVKLLYNQLQGFVTDYENNVSEVKSNLEDARNGLINTLLQVPFGREAYDNLDDASKNFFVEWIKNSEIFKIDPDASEKEVQDQLKSNVDTIENLVDLFATENIQAITDSMSDLDASSLTASDYINQLRTYAKEIWEEIGGAENEYGFKSQTDIEKIFGLDLDAELPKWLDIRETITNYLNSNGIKISAADVGNYFDYQKMTREEMQTFLGIDWNAIGAENVKSIEDVWELIRGTMASQDLPTVKTYTALSESIDSYNDILKQTEEIIADNTVVTEEYKEALIELGISEKELNECFDENNPLVVKNAKALNSLVKSTKSNIAQNVKLAKSQARLEYYELYKELKQLTNGQKIADVATLSRVKSIYTEMTALQKSIARYSMLEQQLLGTANAYDKFAEAQEIDEANDYESKAEELVGYLVDAFHTGKLGTESAQAAITGLVPESVYEDLDTLDEKMAAVYDYFTTDLSKYFYVKFNDDGSLESAEMLVDNVKKFVEDGIANNVFTGSWEEWDLDESIVTLDDLAKKMNVTKEVAFAFLQAMETYDISWIGGDASTLMDKLIPSTSEIQTIKSQIQEAFDQTSIDLTARLNISTEKLSEEGYTGYSTSFDSSTFGLYNDDGSSYQILTTPVLPNGDILGKDELVDYINKQLANGKSLEEIDVFVGAYADADTAKEAAQTLDEALKYYYDKVKSYNLENAISANIQKQAELEYKLGTGQIDADTVVSADGVTTASQQLAQLRAEEEANAQMARENAAAWTEAKEKYDAAAEAVNECNEALKDAQKANDPDKISEATTNLEKAEKTLWNTYAALVECGEPTEVTLTVAMEQVQKDIAKVKGTMNDTELKIVSQLDINNLEKDKNGDWIVNLDAYSNLDETSKAKVQQYLDYLAEEHNINILQGEGAVTTLDVLTEIKDILSQTYELMVKTDDAETKTRSFADLWNSIKDKTVTLTQNVKQGVVSFFTRTPDEGDGVDVDGTAHATGSWGAPKTETALVGELGPEMLVRNGRWTTIGNNGAEFREIRKGDIIFNHKQTSDLLSKGYVTSRGKLHGMSAFAGGTAYAVHPWLNGMNIDEDWNNIDIPIWNEATNYEYLDDASDAADEFADSIDWIEIRMEELDETLGKLNAELENATNYVGQNNIIDQMIGVNKQKYADSLAGAAYYENYANKYWSQIPSQYREWAKNGAIAISDFAGDANEAVVEAIQNYRDYAQKAADLTQQAEEIITEIRDLAIQRIDNAYEYGKVRATVEESQTDKLQSYVDLDEEMGLVTSEAYYLAMMENSNKKIEYLTKARDAMQEELNEAVRNGEIIKGSNEWYEMIDQMYQIDAEIAEATIELEEFQNAINDIYWDNFENLTNRIEYLKDQTQSLIDLMENSGDLVADPVKRKHEGGTVEYWTADDVDWTDEGLASLGLYAQQMEIAEFEAKQYAEAIDDLNEQYAEGRYSESEYLEKLNELTSAQYDSIEAYYEAQDAIIELNEARIDSIKEGIEKEIEAYEELIDAKKKELEAEKDLYDFQKSTMDQQKNIADIERKLAALANDNSMSAVAKRKQLEAELAEAQYELQDTYYNRSVEDKQTALDKELEDFQEEKDAEITKWEEYLTNVEQVVADSLNVIQANASNIYDTLSSKAQEYDLTLSESIMSPWQDGSLAVSDYQSTFDTAMSSTMDQLEALKQKWQEVINKMAEAGRVNVSNINAENANYASATQTSSKPSSNNNKNNQNNNTSAAKTITVGGKINAGNATIYSNSSGGGASTQYFKNDPIYTVLQESNGYLLVRHHSASSGYSGWFKKSDVKALASGTTGLNKSGIVNIDELGEELVIRAKNGRLTYMEKGSGVVPADLTSNLMEWGKLDPTSMIEQNRPIITAPVIQNKEVNIDLTYGDILHIEEFHGENPDEIAKIVAKQFEKHTKNLNNAIRKFAR
jgi:TP901 family phage tail tape measure protein